MSSQLTRQDVAHVAQLARLSITDEEADTYAAQLSAVLEHARDMESLNIDDVVATSHPLPLENVFREDVVRATLDRDEVMDCAPDAVEGRFSVPRILGEEP